VEIPRSVLDDIWIWAWRLVSGNLRGCEEAMLGVWQVPRWNWGTGVMKDVWWYLELVSISQKCHMCYGHNKLPRTSLDQSTTKLSVWVLNLQHILGVLKSRQYRNYISSNDSKWCTVTTNIRANKHGFLHDAGSIQTIKLTSYLHMGKPKTIWRSVAKCQHQKLIRPQPQHMDKTTRYHQSKQQPQASCVRWQQQ